jgi:hypothetical protein
MRTSRRSIAALMALVVLIAVGMAGLSRPSRLWAAVLFSGVTAALTVALLVALLGRGRTRAFWTGFAVGGWVYLTLQYGPWFETQVGPYTLPTAMLDVLYPLVAPPAPTGTTTTVVTSGGMPIGGSGGYGNNSTSAMMAMMMGRTTMRVAPPSPPPSPWAAWTEVDTNQGWPGTATPAAFYWVGHSLFALLAALAGAVIARRIVRARATDAPTTAT